MKDSIKLFTFLFLILLVITLFIIFSDKFKQSTFNTDEFGLEGFDMENKKEEQKKILKSQRDYYFNRIYKPELLIDNEIGKAIKKCRIINQTGDCSQLTEESQCGYCHDNSGTFLYGNENGVLGPTGKPLANVCNDWYPAKYLPELGMTIAQYECTKKRERETCSKVKDCGDLDSSEYEKCGWCPFKQQGMVKKELTGDEIPKEMRDNMTSGRRWWTSKYNNAYDKKSGDKEQYDECEWDDPIKFTDIIGSQHVCSDFQQLFPCMGEKAFTGEHSVGCMNDQFKKAGCYSSSPGENGYLSWPDLSDNKVYGPQVKRKENINKVGGNNPYTNVYNYFKRVFDYSKREQRSKLTFREAKEMNKLCWDEPSINPCDYEDEEAKNLCLIKLYKEAGCEENGVAYPGNYDANPNFYKRSNLSKYGLNELKSAMKTANLDRGFTYNQKINAISREAKKPINFDNQATRSNQLHTRFIHKEIRYNLKAKTLCYGNDEIVKEKIGKNVFNNVEKRFKDCWEDFVLKMTTIPGIRYSGDTLYISKNNSSSRKFIIKNLTTVGSNVGTIYNINRSDYEKSIFPFWEYKSKLQNYWFVETGWNVFQSTLIEIPGVVKKSSTSLEIDKKSILAKVQSKTGSNSTITRKDFYQNTNGIYTFPYWKYIHIYMNYVEGG